MSKYRGLTDDRPVRNAVGICQGKIGYKSYALANRERARLQSESPGVHYSSYKCKVCLDWHVGHTPGQKGREAARIDPLPERPGEYEELVIAQHHIQGVLSEINEGRPVGWAARRRKLVGDLSAVVERMQEIKAERRRREAEARRAREEPER